MLAFLILIGRTFLGLTAVFIIVSGGFWGWAFGRAMNSGYKFDRVTDATGVSPGEVMGLLLGLLAGFAAAGCICGLTAAVFEIHKHLRNIDLGPSGLVEDDSEPRQFGRREPRVSKLAA